MAKPILLCGLPKAMPSDEIRAGERKLTARLEDYHVLVYGANTDEPKFEVLNAEDLEPLQYEELKKKVQDSWTKPGGTTR